MVRAWLIAAVLLTLAFLRDGQELWMLCEAKSTRAIISAQTVQLSGRDTNGRKINCRGRQTRVDSSRQEVRSSGWERSTHGSQSF